MDSLNHANVDDLFEAIAGDINCVQEKEVTVEEITQGENMHLHDKVVDLSLANKGGVSALNQNQDNVYLTKDEFSDARSNNDKVGT